MSHPIIQKNSERLKMSNKAATMFTAAILKAGGASSDDLKVNLLTTMRMRQKGWNEWAETIMECF